MQKLQKFLATEKKTDDDESAAVRNLLGLSLQRQKKFTEAVAAWREFLVRYPAHPAWNEVQQRIIETEYLVGAEAFQKRDRDATRRIWQAAVQVWQRRPTNRSRSTPCFLWPAPPGAER